MDTTTTVDDLSRCLAALASRLRWLRQEYAHHLDAEAFGDGWEAALANARHLDRTEVEIDRLEYEQEQAKAAIRATIRHRVARPPDPFCFALGDLASTELAHYLTTLHQTEAPPPGRVRAVGWAPAVEDVRRELRQREQQGVA